MNKNKLRDTETYTRSNSLTSGWTFVTILLIICGLISSCLPQTTDFPPPPKGYEYHEPENTHDGWETSSLEDVGIDVGLITRMMNDLVEMDDHHIHSLLIVKEGNLVFEEYFPGEKFNLAQFTGETGFTGEDTHNLCSVTKSFTSAIVGIAIDQGYIQSVQQKVYEFFPEYSNFFRDDPRKKDLTIEHLLTMTSGIDWDDEFTSYSDSRNDMHQMFISSDPIEFILSKDVVIAPGTFFEYSNCNTNLLGEIIRKATGLRIDKFAESYLFDELGIVDFEWQMISPNVVFTSGDLRLRPRDMAKFGYLFLSGGVWGHAQVISQDWIQLSTTKHIDLNSGQDQVDWADGYGFQWWNWESIDGDDFQAYFASGWGGQWIIISPDYDLVIVSTAGNYYSIAEMPIQTILTEYIIPAIEPQ